MQRKQIPLIKSLRGIACLIVICAHILSSDPIYGIYANGCGKIGVWCFLVISGFLAMQSMEHTNKIAFLNNKKSWMISYYLKKLFRLYPSYTVALLLGFCIGFLPAFSELAKHLFCLEGTGHFWYMPVIIKFNLILPIGYFLYITISEKWFLIINSNFPH